MIFRCQINLEKIYKGNGDNYQVLKAFQTLRNQALILRIKAITHKDIRNRMG